MPVTRNMRHQLAANEQLDSSGEQEEYRNTHLPNEANVEENLGKQYSSRSPLLGEAREAIEDCVMLPPKEGYVRAIDILESQFGCPDDVAECLLDEMGNGTKIKPTDITGLKKLVRQVVSSEISLTEMGYESSLNCPTTVKGIVRRLPDSMQLRWAEIALKKRREGTKLLFRPLVRFPEESLSTFSYCYGQGNSAISKWKGDED
ncbi:Protein disulfide-isomerase, partial [Fasciola hepatica]